MNDGDAPIFNFAREIPVLMGDKFYMSDTLEKTKALYDHETQG